MEYSLSDKKPCRIRVLNHDFYIRSRMKQITSSYGLEYKYLLY